MPHKLEPIFVQLAAAVASFFSMIASLFPALATGIVDDHQLLMICVAGAIGGSFVSIGFFPPKSPSPQVMAWKFLASTAFAMLFAPWAASVRWDAPNSDQVLMMSGFIGLCAFSLATFVRRVAVKRAGKLLGDDEDRPD